ncbi:MAG: hypothetical protein ABR543_01610 [Gemmatimonadaceae bacterium]
MTQGGVLIRLFLRRSARQLIFALCFVPALLILFALNGSLTAENITAAFGAGALSFAIIPVHLIAMDRYMGQLEMLCGLPVSARLHARARLTAATIIAAPGVVFVGVAAAAGTRVLGLSGEVAVRMAVVSTLGVIVLYLGMIYSLMALAAHRFWRYAFNAPLLLFIILVLGSSWVDKLLRYAGVDLRELMLHPSAPLIASVLCVLLAGGWLLASFRFLSDGLAKYRPDRVEVA